MIHLFTVRDYLIDGVEWLNQFNCDIDNNAVFDYASTQFDEPYAVVVSHTFSDQAYQYGNVQNQLFDWRVLINFFVALRGSKEEQAGWIQDGYVRTGELIAYLCSDFTLDGKVMDGNIHAVTTPMTYSRNDRDEYFMIGIVLTIKESLNG